MSPRAAKRRLTFRSDHRSHRNQAAMNESESLSERGLRTTMAASQGAELRKVIIGASLGTVFEWYDFFIYAILAATLSRQFFAGIDETSAFIVTLLSFAAGTAIRPLGALVFG